MPYLISIIGPTAVGKTALAIELANYFHTEIISADSRQFYEEMSIGTAKPTPEEQAAAPHHFIGNVPVEQLYSAGDFERDALQKLDELYLRQDIAIMVGGSGLYVKAVLEGLDEMPQANMALRAELQQLFENYGIAILQQRLKELDADKYAAMDIQNTQRVMRAIEIAEGAKMGTSPVPAVKQERNFEVIKIGLNLPREMLYDRINKRVDQMMDAGLLEEVTRLEKRKHLNALQTVGYSELFDHLEGKHSLSKAVELIKQHTRNFAKRQLTWFRREKDIHWFEPQNSQEIISFIEHKTHHT